jgi:hypothetical protein
MDELLDDFYDLIPPVVRPYIADIVGGNWPEADADGCYAASDHYSAFSSSIHGTAGHGDTTYAQVVDFVDGAAAASLGDYWHQFTSAHPHVLPSLADSAESAAAMLNNYGLQVEYTKAMIIAMLILVAWQLVQLLAWAFATFGGSAAAIPAVVTIARMTATRFWLMLLENVAMMEAPDFLIQLYQVIIGRRKSWDLSATFTSILSGLASGLAAAGMHVGIARLGGSGLAEGMARADMGTREKLADFFANTGRGKIMQGWVAGSAGLVPQMATGNFSWKNLMPVIAGGMAGAADHYREAGLHDRAPAGDPSPGEPGWLRVRAQTLGDERGAWVDSLSGDQVDAVEKTLAPGGLDRLNAALHGGDPVARAAAVAQEHTAKQALASFPASDSATLYAHPTAEHMAAIAAGEDVSLGSAISASPDHVPASPGGVELVLGTRHAVDVSDLVGHPQSIVWSSTRVHVLADEHFPTTAHAEWNEPERRVFVADLPADNAPPAALRFLRDLGPNPLDHRPLPAGIEGRYNDLVKRAESGKILTIDGDAELPSIRPVDGISVFGVADGSLSEFLTAHGLNIEDAAHLVGAFKSGDILRSMEPLSDGDAQTIANGTIKPVIYPTRETRIDTDGNIHIAGDPGTAETPSRGSWRVAVPDRQYIPDMPGERGPDGIRRFPNAGDIERYGHFLTVQNFDDLPFDELQYVATYQASSWPFNDIFRSLGSGMSHDEMRAWWDSMRPGMPLFAFEDSLDSLRPVDLIRYHKDPLLSPLVHDVMGSRDMDARLEHWKNTLGFHLHQAAQLYIHHGEIPSFDDVSDIMDHLRSITSARLPEGVAAARSLRSIDFLNGFDPNDPESLTALENTVQTEHGLMSVSIGSAGYWAKTERAEGYPYRLLLDLPAGTRGRVSAFNDMYEIILAPGATYKITKVVVNPDGTADLHGTVIPE